MLIKYPMAGMPSEHVSLGIYDLASGKTVFIAADDFGKEQYLTNPAWTPDGELLLVQVLDRAQKHMRLNAYDASTGEFVANSYTGPTTGTATATCTFAASRTARSKGLPMSTRMWLMSGRTASTYIILRLKFPLWKIICSGKA